MRRRLDDSEFPARFLVFDGRDLKTMQEWCDAYDEFCDARRSWWSDRNLPDHELPDFETLSFCPFDPDSI